MTRNTIRERIVAEMVRRITAHPFEGATFANVLRSEIPDGYDSSSGALLALLEGTERFLPALSRIRESDLEVFAVFAVPLAPGEEGATVCNNVAGEIVEFLGNLRSPLVEGGDGSGGEGLQFIACSEQSFSPSLEDGRGGVAQGEILFSVKFRTSLHRPFTRTP